MWSFAAFCDEFCVSTRLHLKLDLELSRETLLHFFERIRRAYPAVTRLRRRDDGGLVLDEDGAQGDMRRFVRIDPHALKLGCYTPPNAELVDEFATMVLTQAPPHLSLSDLDYDHLEVVFAFDLEYRGNHDELVAETFYADHRFVGLLADEGRRVIDCQPFLGVALSEDCERQAYLEIKGRTSTYEIRSGEFEASPLSVYLIVRNYWGCGGARDLAAINSELLHTGARLANERVLPHIVQPLAAAIASRR
ncbi:MAG: hypothetical protein KKB50_14195 [Planctomycetes bacterium]|nr:hypothetical protein [Planctomycetota bacterium]